MYCSEDNGLGDEEDMVLDEADHAMELYNGTVRLGTSAEEENGSGVGDEMEAIPAVAGRGSRSVDLMSPGKKIKSFRESCLFLRYSGFLTRLSRLDPVHGQYSKLSGGAARESAAVTRLVNRLP